MKRRDIIKAAGGTVLLGGAGLAGCKPPQQAGNPSVVSGKTWQWRMVTCSPKHFPGPGPDTILRLERQGYVS